MTDPPLIAPNSAAASTAAMTAQAQAAAEQAAPVPAREGAQRVVFLAFDHHQPLDLVGPLQVFALANREGARPGYELVVAAETAGRVKGESGPDLCVDAGLEALDSADTIMVPGGPGVSAAVRRAAVLAALRRNSGRVRRLCAVCTGAFLLAEIGALNGRKATTHWRECAALARRFPLIEVQDTPIFVHDRGVWTSAGVTAGIDMALSMVEQDYGHAIAARVARDLVVYLRRPGGQAQFSEPLALQQTSEAGVYAQLLDTIAASLRKHWSVEAMAELAGQSVRTFQRHFQLACGCSPAAAVQQLRVTHARLMLETTTVAPAKIASRCGFGSEEQMRRAFHRQFGVAPGAFRAFFGEARGEVSGAADLHANRLADRVS